MGVSLTVKIVESLAIFVITMAHYINVKVMIMLKDALLVYEV